MSYALSTDMTFTVTGGRDAEEYQLELSIKYRFDNGAFYIDDVVVIEPAVGIFSPRRHLAPPWLWHILESDEALRDECFADYKAREECAADDHADMLRRERQLGDR